jgi:IstB-like ATP binding protein/GDSL-like lipase/acylhydrolase family protein
MLRLRRVVMSGALSSQAFAITTRNHNADRTPARHWLGLLVDREVTHRRDKRLAARLRYARLRHQAVVEDVDYRAPRGLDRALFHKLASGAWIDAHDNLILLRTDRRRQKLACLCSRSQGLPRQPLGALSTRPQAVRRSRPGARQRALCPCRLDKALADRPDIVILELGANDALRGVDPAITRSNLAAMISKIRGTGAKLLLTGILAPPNWGEEYRQAFDRIYPELARSSAFRRPVP